MSGPVIQQSDLLQKAPRTVIAGDKETIKVNYYQDDGTGQVLVGGSVNFNACTCSIRNLDDPDTEIDDPTVTKTVITNGTQLSFQVDASVTATYPIGRYVAKLKYVLADESPDDELSDLIYFNVVGVTNPFS